MKNNRTLFYVGVFLLCMSVLMLQIVQTRVLSVVSYYYLAFLTISMAMFGLTAGALIVYFGGSRFSAKTLSYDLRWTTSAYAISVAGCFLIQLSSLAVTVSSATGIIVWLKLILLLATPFVFAGMAVSLALTRSPFAVGTVYGVDMTGAAAGCLGVLILLNLVDGPSAVFVIASVAALAARCFAAAEVGSSPDKWALNWWILRSPGVLAVGLVALAILNSSTTWGFQPVAGKQGIEYRRLFEFERWNSFSRIVAYKPRTEKPYLWGPSPALPEGIMTNQRSLNIDGLAGTNMYRFGGDPNSVDFLHYDITNLAYQIRRSGRAAVIGVGGGRDLLAAHVAGFRDITGVELNPIFIDWLTDPARLRSYAGLADIPGLRFIVDDGRSWFARTRGRFDVIQMSMIDTFAATGAGAFSLSENGLYTTEGWSIFLSALAPHGVFTVSRWHAPDMPVETARVVSLAISALFEQGMQNPRNHIFLASAERLSTIIVSRDPFQGSDVALLEEAADKLKFKTLISPARPPGEKIFEDLLAAQSTTDLSDRARKYLLDVSPPSDARPFFFNQLRLSRPQNLVTLLVLGATRGTGSFLVTGNLLAACTLALLIALSLFLVIVVIILPARTAIAAVDKGFVRVATVYFLLIGLGFMFVEIGLIQRVSVFMGHPTYGLSIVLFTIILSTGLGSFLSERVPLTASSHFLVWLLLLGTYLLSVPVFAPAVLRSMQSAELLSRAIVSVGIMAPAGLLMGYGFPTGMRLVNAQDPRATPWLWGVNGAAGVLGAGLAVACSIAFSIDTTLCVGALCYLLLLPVALSVVTKISGKVAVADAKSGFA